MENKPLDALNREQLIDVMTQALKKMSEAHDEASNIADLWSWVSSEQQETCCRSLADGLAIAKQMLNQAISAKTSKVSVE